MFEVSNCRKRHAISSSISENCVKSTPRTCKNEMDAWSHLDLSLQSRRDHFEAQIRATDLDHRVRSAVATGPRWDVLVHDQSGPRKPVHSRCDEDQRCESVHQERVHVCNKKGLRNIKPVDEKLQLLYETPESSLERKGLSCSQLCHAIIRETKHSVATKVTSTR
ncbi:unnamed protein product [Xylocopa violacea]|uniref:Uncharacterized protein n=1 Tax=Xylocopa violacea TaxID=135666 RepID=A0ABP1NKU4_XYLVO